MNRKTISALVRALFKQANAEPSKQEIDRYCSHLAKFDGTWKTARDALGDDWRYAQSLHEARLLVSIRWPRIKDDTLVRMDHVYCIAPRTTP